MDDKRRMNRIGRLIALSAALSCVAACVSPKPPEVVAFATAFKKVHTGMEQAEVNTLLGRPSIVIKDATPEWGLSPATIATYTSTNRTGIKGIAMILYLRDRVTSKGLGYTDPQKATCTGK